MTPKHKITAIRLMEKIKKNPDYAKHLGIESKINKNDSEKKELEK